MMRSISDLLLLGMPALLALLLLALFAAPMTAGLSLVPNIAWVMTLVIALFYPPAWPRWFAFMLGMLQDIVFGTPLGAQALLTLLLVQFVAWQMPRQALQRFQMRWLEAAGILLFWHLLLGLLDRFVTQDAPSWFQLLRMGVTSALWYPIFYFLLTRLLLLLPPLK